MSDTLDQAFDDLCRAIAAWDPPDELGFTKADYQSDDFDPLTMLRSGKRRPQPQRPEPTHSNNTGPK